MTSLPPKREWSATELLGQARHLLERHNTIAAGELCDLAIRKAPADPNAFLLAGRVAGREGRWREALGLFECSASLAPHAAAPHFWLGRALRALGNDRAAIVAFSQARRLLPSDSATAFNLGLTFLSLDDVASAGQAFVFAARCSGMTLDAEAHQRVIECALALSATQPPVTLSLHALSSRNDVTVSVVCCSITPTKAVALRSNLSRVLANRHWEFVLIEDARSLCEGYQRGLAQCRGEIIILCHDDIEILPADFYERLVDAFSGADVVGVAGTTLVNGPAVFWARYPHCHGWVSQLSADGNLLPTLMSMSQPRIDGAQALDGLFIAARRGVFDRVQFDATTFDGFHVYDLDFTYRAYLAGFRLRIQCDILMIHESNGNFDDVYVRYAELFTKKFPHVGCAPHAAAIGFNRCAPSKQALRNMYQWIGFWTSSRSIETGESEQA